MNKKKELKNKQKTSKQHRSSGLTKVYTGVVDITRSGMAYVVIDELDQDIRVNPANLQSALNGDEVKVEVIRKGKSSTRQEGKVIRVTKRKNTIFSGTINMNKGFAFLITADEALPDIYIDEENLANAKDGDKAVIEIINWGDEKHNPAGKVDTVLDKTDLNDTAMKEILIENGFPLTFPKDVIAEAGRIPDSISPDEVKVGS